MCADRGGWARGKLCRYREKFLFSAKGERTGVVVASVRAKKNKVARETRRRRMDFHNFSYINIHILVYVGRGYYIIIIGTEGGVFF